MKFSCELVLLTCCLILVSALASDIAKSRSKRFICRTCERLTLGSGDDLEVIPVVGASEVLSVELVSETTPGTCDLGSTFGAYGPTVFLRDGCQGDFRVCYREGFVTEINCESSGSAVGCATECDNVGSLAVKKQNSIVRHCHRDLSYTLFGNNITVFDSCKADFYVGCEACRLFPGNRQERPTDQATTDNTLTIT